MPALRGGRAAGQNAVIPMTAIRFATSSVPLEKLTGCSIERAYVDKGYRGHQTTNARRVFISGQKRGVLGAIKREFRRFRHRGRHRPHESRWPPRSRLPEGVRRRRRQRHPHRGRLQSPPLLAWIKPPLRVILVLARDLRPSHAQLGFLTADFLYCSTDRLCRSGAAVQNLSIAHPSKRGDKNAPSKRGTKHLDARREVPFIATGEKLQVDVSLASTCAVATRFLPRVQTSPC